MITKDMTIENVLIQNFSNAFILKKYGLNCLGCSHASEETLEIGAQIHNIDIEELLEALNNS